MNETAIVYVAKCYWPGFTEAELERAMARAAREGSYIGSLLFPDDDLVLCLFEGSSPSEVAQAAEAAGIPCERVMRSVVLSRPATGRKARWASSPR